MRRGTALILVLSLLGLSPAQRAQAEDVCQNWKEDGGQRATYCKAAEDAGKSSDTAKIGMGIWGAVAGVCTYACASSTSPAYAINAWWCMGSSLAGSVGDMALTMALTKDMQSSMMGLMGLGVTGMTFMFQRKEMAARNAVMKSNKSMLKSKQQGPLQKQDRDTGSCISAAMALVQVGLKAFTMNNSEKTRKSNLEMAASVYDPAANIPQYVGSSSALNSTTAARSAGPIGGSSSPQSDSSGVSSGSNTSAATLGSGFPELEKIAKDPGFKEAFQQVSGKSLDDYLKSLNSGSSAADAVGGAMGALSNAGEIKTKMAALTQEMKEKMDMSSGSRAIASIGGGGGGSSGGEGEMIASAMAQMMAGLMPGQEKKQDPSIQEIEYLLNKKGAEALSQDRSISIFKRVAYRYRLSTERLEAVPWASAQNRSIAQVR